jgi:hypothetical protein
VSLLDKEDFENSLPEDGEEVEIMRKGRLVKATYREWVKGTQYAKVEYKGETIKEKLYYRLKDSEPPQMVDLVQWHKDANAEATRPVIKRLDELERPLEDDRNELLHHRYLCRGSGMLLVGQSGTGKSSLTMQALIHWAIGKPFFGITPKWQLRSLLIQAENDEGDLSEFVDSMMEGLNLTDEEEESVNQNIVTCRDNSTQSTDFFNKTVRPALEMLQSREETRIDLLVIDPALAYLGGDQNSQKDVGTFLRNELNPLLTEFDIAVIVIHHTPKPPRENGKLVSMTGRALTYAGAGSAEWDNWARATMTLWPSSREDIHGHPTYELGATKRGGRLGWKDANGERAFSKYIRHSHVDNTICWHEVDESELAYQETPSSKRANKEDQFVQDVLEALGESETLPTADLIGLRRNTGLGDNSARDLLKRLVSEKRIMLAPKSCGGKSRGDRYALNDGKFEQE